MAGLAAALSLTDAGRPVTLYEAGPAAGGRCRSYLDKELGLRIDNGNHLLLSGNRAAMDYIAEIGAEDRFNVPRHAVFPFLDLKTRETWAIRPNRGRIPWWVLFEGRRVPHTRLSDYLRLRRIVRIPDGRPRRSSRRCAAVGFTGASLNRWPSPRSTPVRRPRSPACLALSCGRR